MIKALAVTFVRNCVIHSLHSDFSLVSIIAIGSERSMPDCSHEETDTRIAVHTLHAVQAEYARKVLVRIVDTDVIVILVGKYHFLNEIQPDLDLWVAFGMGRSFRFISVISLFVISLFLVTHGGLNW